MVSSNTSMLYAFVLSRLLLQRDAKGGGGSKLNVTMMLSEFGDAPLVLCKMQPSSLSI